MAIEQRAGTKVIKNLRREEAGATRVDPYPYIGIVKNNIDPTRAGRLQVWIPDLGGEEDQQLNWRTVNYSSPYMGYTTHQQTFKDPINKNNTFDGVNHTYGMWMVPPDIGVQVIVLFIAGDPLRGYWISCVNPNLSHHMIPGLAGSPNAIGNDVNGKKGTPVPVVEFNENIEENIANSNFHNLDKPIHTYQYDILQKQGLDKDPIRGAIGSSSQRESPSHVFGISTPGRPTNDPADDENYVTKLNADTLADNYHRVTARKGGHTFVMDDGATLGEDQLVRLRTAKGHQILMHDTTKTLYIAHADGTSWIELTNDGKVNVYSQSGFNVRTEGDINLHSDSNINITAANDFNLKAGNKIQIESARTTLLTGSLGVETGNDAEFKIGARFNVETGSSLSLKVGTTYALEGLSILNNSGSTVAVPKIEEFKLTNTALNTIVTVAPTHEPFRRRASTRFFNPENAESGITPQAKYSGATDATKNLAGTEVKHRAAINQLRNQKVPLGTVGNLSKDQLTAYLAQMGHRESTSNYKAENQFGYVGKYQFSAGALEGEGYVRSDVTKEWQLANPNSWTGKDGIKSKEDWLNNASVQESAMLSYTKKNYDRMISNGAITAADSPEEVGGMLSVGHLLGPNLGTLDRPGALGWRMGRGGADANKTTGNEYFQIGKHAVSVLGPQVAAAQERQVASN